MADAFTTAHAPDLGCGRGALRGRTVRRQLRGAYVPAWVADTVATRVEAARQVLPHDVSPDGVTALQLLGVNVARAAHPAQAFVAAARDLDLVDLVAAGDWSVRLRLTTPEELVAAAGVARGPWSAHARRAAALVRDRVDSVRETRLRLAVVLAGLPEPEVNPTVRVGGLVVGRVDLLLRRWRVVLEYEGDQHRTDVRQWNRDVWRQERLVEDGHALVRVTAERMRAPRTVVLGVHQVLVERGYDGPAPGFDADWRALFVAARQRTRHAG